MTKYVISFAFSDNDHITHINKYTFDKLQNLIEPYDRIVTINFSKIFNLSDKSQIFDIDHIKKLYKHDFVALNVKHKNNKIVTQFLVANACIKHKLTSFNYANQELINDSHLDITPLQLMMPKYMLDEITKANIKYLKFIDEKFIRKSNVDYYTNMFRNYITVYNNLSRAAANKLYILAALQKSKSDNIPKQIFNATNEFKDNLITQPKYNLFSSKTGRPYIVSGVNYQQLPITHSNVIKSKWNTGKIYEFDFNGCEIRAALFAVGNYKLANINEDIYEYFINLMKKTNVKLSRAKAKKFIIMMLFGATPNTLSKLIKISMINTNTLVQILENEFQTNIIYDMIVKAVKKHGYFHNFFERPIYTDKETRKETLIQNFIQSTAIDICHSGYASFVNFARKEKLVSKALYTKHDAIRIDFHPNELHHVDEIARIIGKTNIKNINFRVTVKE
tara:strand:+ start:5 stop:1351 length:1347 start_codon:yes stop_codon:yes gene_type:complete